MHSYAGRVASRPPRFRVLRVRLKKRCESDLNVSLVLHAQQAEQKKRAEPASDLLFILLFKNKKIILSDLSLGETTR